MRPLCYKCNERPAAVNYKKGNKTYYRRLCEMCLRYGGPSGYMPKWYVAGYRPKQQCDKCGHKSEYKERFRVFHIDANLNNCKFNNLKTYEFHFVLVDSLVPPLIGFNAFII